MTRSLSRAALLAACVSSIAMPSLAETTICTQITTIPYIINTSGIYCLDSDFPLSMSSGAAITIGASDVTLDMNRHVLNNTGAGPTTTAVGIAAHQQKNVVIKNGAVQGFYIAVAITDTTPPTASQGNLIESIAAEGSGQIGLLLEGQGNVARHNLVTATVGARGGIYVAGADNVVHDNDISGPGSPSSVSSRGIFAYFTQGLVIDNNRISFGPSTTSNGFEGISLYQSSDTIIRNNSIVKVDSGGSTPSRSSAIYAYSATNAAIASNHVTGFFFGIVAVVSTAVDTTGNVIVGATVPVTGTTPATTY
jgi:hypothetical protein